MADKYDAHEIERKWQDRWATAGLYRATEDSPKPKYYALTMFPYTSGDLHIGHWYTMAPADVQARFMRMRGYNVMHPIGFDAFGLPAENAAISEGVHPFNWTMANIDNMRRQLKTLGASYDWDREIITCQPEYYKWSQWFFLKLYEHDLAYQQHAPVNWCSNCQTVLANEQVVEGECERCQTVVTRRDLEQWFFRITRYADELKDHVGIDWPERIQTMQRNWVGRSTGTEISFGLDHPGVDEKEVRVFTTRPDTTFGVTFMALAPEHPLVARLTDPEKRVEVEEYVARSRAQSEIERLSTEKEKDGVFIGAYVTNRVNGEQVPVWIADYVLVSYGTGCVMGVPAHDERDFAFARKYNLPIRVVIAPPGWDGSELDEAYIEPGTMVNSAQFDGQSNREGIAAISDFFEERDWGKRTVSYRLRDWLISRQRYWGAPIPIVYCDQCGTVPVPEEDLPVLLPEDAEFRPTGESPLASNEAFVTTTCPRCGGPARRETDTLDTFMCSSWYFLRFANATYAAAAFDPKKLKYWLPVDLYTGGAEHAVMHLFYARFFIKALRDMGLIDFSEPFTRLFNQGVITANHQKMSKSRGNVISPDKYVSTLGADTFRAYLMFIGPWEQGGDWSDTGISGMSRWLNRVWNLALDGYTAGTADGHAREQALTELRRVTHQTIRKVGGDIERFRFNTMIAALMESTNFLSRVKETGAVSEADWREAIDSLLLLLAPPVPHIADELWERTGHEGSIHSQSWPEWDKELARDEEVTLIVQVNGRLRDRIVVPAIIGEDEARRLAAGSTKVKAHTDGKQLVKAIYVPGKLVNLVVK